MKPIGFIYLTTCIVNGKIYIGKHELNNKSEGENYIGSGTLFQRAVKKYGKENFERKILRLCYSLHELKIWEHVYIVKYKSYTRSIGYNIAMGDVNTSEYNPAKLTEVREKISKSAKIRFSNPSNRPMLGKSNPHTKEWKIKHSEMMTGRKHTEETKAKISKSQKGEKNHMYGKHLSDETKKKLSKIFSGKNNPMYGISISGVNHHFYGSRFIWINNGVVNKRGKIDEPIPEGWSRGKIQKKKNLKSY